MKLNITMMRYLFSMDNLTSTNKLSKLKEQ